MGDSTLFLVATPIGNLEDITLRALRVLREADLIAAEDTRRTAKLLTHYDIHTKTTSFYEQVEREKTPRLLAHLASGRSLALVSDAGTPGISDPGYRLTRAAIEAGFRVEAVPGASAVLAALVPSGLPTDSFSFVGFPPPKAKAREGWFRGSGGPSGDPGVLRGAAPDSEHARGGAGCLGRSTDFCRPRVDEAPRGNGARQRLRRAGQARPAAGRVHGGIGRRSRGVGGRPFDAGLGSGCWTSLVD